MKFIGVGGREGGGKLKAGNSIHSEANSSTETATVNLVDVDSRWQQFDTPCNLLVPLSGTTDPVVDRRSFTGSAKDCLYKQNWPSIAL